MSIVSATGLMIEEISSDDEAPQGGVGAQQDGAGARDPKTESVLGEISRAAGKESETAGPEAPAPSSVPAEASGVDSVASTVGAKSGEEAGKAGDTEGAREAEAKAAAAAVEAASAAAAGAASEDASAEGEDEFHDADDGGLGMYAQDKARSLAAKDKGNKLFGEARYDDALDAYAEALLCAETEDVENRAVFHNNKAAAHFMLKQWDEVVYETTQAVQLKPDYARAYQRRAKAFEASDRLSEALEDYKAAEQLLPGDRALRAKTAELGERVSKRFEEQKEEMLGKLKDLGNSLLGKFGMSLDQFKAVKDPVTGSYSISFGNGGPGGAGAGGQQGAGAGGHA